MVEFDRSINAAIMKLRIALGDTGDKPRIIETLVRRGYRLMVSVEWKEGVRPNNQLAKLDRVPWLAARCLTTEFSESWAAAVWGWSTRAKT